MDEQIFWNDCSHFEVIDIVQLVEEDTNNNVLDLVKKFYCALPMVFRMPDNYKPTDTKKLEDLWLQIVHPEKYNVKFLASGVFIKEICDMPSNSCLQTVSQFLPNGCKVETYSHHIEEERNFWNNIQVLKQYACSVHGTTICKYDRRRLTLLPLESLMSKTVHCFSEPIEGITKPTLSLSKFGSTFSFQLAEKESWLISYLHKGHAKIWYFLEPVDARRVEIHLGQVLQQFSLKYCTKNCPTICRHNILFLQPTFLESLGYKVRKVIQSQGCFVIVPPRCYFWGISLGESISEDINFFTNDDTSIQFGLSSLTCPFYEQKNPSLDMEWFVWVWWPQHYKAYINGHLSVQDPVDYKTFLVPSPCIKFKIKVGNHALESGGIFSILAAKTQQGKQCVYVKSTAGFSWIDRSYAETLLWISDYKDKSVLLPDIIFSMEENVITHFSEINMFLQQHAFDKMYKLLGFPDFENDDELSIYPPSILNVYLDSDSEHELLPKKQNKQQIFNPRVKNCKNCGKSYQAYKTSSSWSVHQKKCRLGKCFSCEICDKKFYLQGELKKHCRRKHILYSNG